MRRSYPILPISILLAAAALFLGCGKKAASPAAGGGGTSASPALIATQPAARAASAPYDGDIWAQFDRPLDGRTVSTQTTYLKLDGQRIPIEVRYDGITHRVFLRPLVVLELRRTYTAEFSTSILSLDGVPLPEGVYFQFTTNSLRRIVYDFPAVDALEGPVAALGWGGTTGPQSNIFFDVYASEDSLAVLTRTAPRLQHSVFTRYLTTQAWAPGRRVYWAVTGENALTGERENGPMRSFRVLDGSVPVDSIVIRPSDHGSSSITNRNTQFCNSVSIPCGPSFNAAIHWNFTALPSDARVVDARIRLWFLDQNAGAFAASQPVVWMAQNEWTACSVTAPGPPYAEPSGQLANAYSVDNLESDFRTDRLSAAIEALARRRTFTFSTVFRTSTNVNFHSTVAVDPAKSPVVVVRYQRLSAAATP